MSDLAEIRRFWPHAGHWYLFGEIYVPKPTRRHMLSAMQSSDGSWYVTRHEAGCTRMAFFDGPTIAAAMAAAGFARRKPGRYASYGRINAKAARSWQQGMLPDYCRCELVSRQRPRKGVRLGKRRRIGGLAAELSIVLRLWDLGEQRRLDRGEIGQ